MSEAWPEPAGTLDSGIAPDGEPAGIEFELDRLEQRVADLQELLRRLREENARLRGEAEEARAELHGLGQERDGLARVHSNQLAIALNAWRAQQVQAEAGHGRSCLPCQGRDGFALAQPTGTR